MIHAADASYIQKTDISASFNSNGGNFLVAAVETYATGGGARTVSSVTYGGVAFTQVLAQDMFETESGDLCHFYIYTLSSPLGGSNTFAITTSGSTSNNIVCSLVSIGGVNRGDAVEGTAYNNDVNNTNVGMDPTVTLSITQVKERDSYALLYGTMKPNTTGSNFHTAGSGYTELLSSASSVGGASGVFSAYRIYTNGAGAKIIDNGDSNYDSPGPGAPRTHAEIGILLNAAEPHGRIILAD